MSIINCLPKKHDGNRTSGKFQTQKEQILKKTNPVWEISRAPTPQKRVGQPNKRPQITKIVI